jgi:hypothetical protein
MFRLSRIVLFLASGLTSLASPLLVIRDGLDDLGSVPYQGTNKLYASPDIWVKTTPNPNYDPRPYKIGKRPWLVGTREDPVYRDPRYGRPNYLYVAIRNLGSTKSSGKEVLRTYWSKPGVGQSWSALGPGPSNHWEDFLAKPCGAYRLYGSEITLTPGVVTTRSEFLRASFNQAFHSAAGGDLGAPIVSPWPS